MHKLRAFIILIEILLWVLAPFWSVKVYASGMVLITGLQTGSSSNASSEYVEITNQSGGEVVVDSWRLRYASSTGISYTTKATLTGIITDGESMTFATSAYVGVAQNRQIMVEGLAQAGGHIQLVDNLNNVIDLLGWGTAIHPEVSSAQAPSAGQGLHRKIDSSGLFVDTDNNLLDFNLVDLTTTLPAVDLPPEPIANAGLILPVISEMLPNPASPQTDEKDEFVELYNPNSIPFSLAGYKLQTGRSFSYSLNFTDQVIPALSYVDFTSGASPLTLSNTDGLARLLDSSGLVVDQTDAYGLAPEGQSWALIEGFWMWTLSPTPAMANSLTLPLPPIIKEPAVKATTTKQAAPIKPKTSNVKAASATKSTSTNQPSATGSGSSPPKPSSRLHPAILAGVGGLALIYGVYEYRHDIKNALYRFKRYRIAGKENRQSSEGGRGD